MTARQTTQPSLAQASIRHEGFVQADYKAPPDDSQQAALPPTAGAAPMEMNNVTSISRTGKDTQGGGAGGPHMYPSPVIALHCGGRVPVSWL